MLSSQIMVSSQHHDEWVPCPRTGKEEKGCGVTKMGKIIRARNKGVSFKTTWNAIGLPVGKDTETMMSYRGTSIGKNVPITIPSWKKFPQRLLDAFFEDVASELSRNGIWTKEGQIRDKPPEIYNFIKLKDWKDFSKAVRKSAEANLYPQKKARRGYARYEQDLRELKKIKKARSEGEDSHSEEEDLEAFNIHDINETNTTPKIDIPEVN
ncbi:Pyruvate decarboxylase 4 [Bienertia sinuspersici]